MTIGRQLGLAAAVLPLLVMSACSDEPEPKFAPPSDSPSVSASTSAPPAPEPWEEKSTKGAVAFAEHWIEDVFSTAINDGDVTLLREISARNCVSCNAIIDRIEAIRRDGGFYFSPGWRVLEADANDEIGGSRVSVITRVLQGRERFKESSDSPVQRNGSARGAFEMVLVWHKHWVLEELTEL